MAPKVDLSDFPKILFEGPMNLDGYDRSKLTSGQPSDIPILFTEAMEVREEVFVHEQGVPLLMEADSDDARSCHWVAYDMLAGEPLPIPAGTIRLVPFPHDPHPLPGSSWDVDAAAEGISHSLDSKIPPYIVDRPTTFHDGKEPYIKLGRWAVRKDFRGRWIANKLVRRTLDWAQENPEFFNSLSNNSTKAHFGPELDPKRLKWKGLVCIHAQEYLVKAWSKFGFQVDEGMGKWTEAGIPHVGMFLRLDISKSKAESD